MFFRYFFTGGVAAAFDLVFFFIFHTLLDYNYLVIGGLGFILATAINYIISIKIVFESGAKFNKKQEISMIYLVSGIGLVFHELVLYFTVSNLQLEALFGKILATGIVFFWNYLVRKHYVFNKG